VNRLARRSVGVLAITAMAWSWPGGAWAQEQPAPGRPETRTEPAPDEQAAPSPFEIELLSGNSPERLLADGVAREVLRRLRSTGSPGADDYRLAALGLRAAIRLAPDDLHLHRRLAEAQRAAGDFEDELETLRRIRVLDPDDTVTQLRLINQAIRSRQTVEDRLAGYDRVLGDAGEGLDDAVRSRLALDAALLAREAGDERGFVTRLTRATQLDATNKPAAVLAARFALDRLDDPLARIEAMANVILADPVDAQAHLDLARELLAHGAYAGADRFLERASDILNRAGRRISPELRTDRIVIDWAMLGPEELFRQFDDATALERYVLDQRQRAVDEGDLPEEEAPGPYVPRQWREQGRLAIALATDNADQTARALEALATLDNQRLEQIGESETPEQEAAAERARLGAAALLRELWADAAQEDAGAQLNQLTTLGDLDDETVSLVRGWILLREGRLQEARATLEPLAPDNPRATAGLGVSFEAEGRAVDAARRYALLVRDAPGTLLGMWARERIERLLDQPVRQAAMASELDSYALALPRALDRMTRDPSTYVDLSIEHARPRIGMLGRSEVVIRMRNTGVLPLAVGDEAPMNSRVLLVPVLRLSGAQVLDNLAPEVVSMATRLRLEPNESVEVVYWAGQGPAGRTLALVPALRATLRWRALQGFGTRADGTYAPGAMSMSASTELLQRTAPPEAQLAPPAIINRLRESDGEPRRRALAMVLWLLANGGNLPDEDERFQLRTAMAEAVVDAWPELTPAERAWALLRTPDSLSVPEAGAIEEIAFETASPETLLALTISRGGAFPDRVLPLAAASEDDLVSAYARMRQRIRAGFDEAAN